MQKGVTKIKNEIIKKLGGYTFSEHCALLVEKNRLEKELEAANARIKSLETEYMAIAQITTKNAYKLNKIKSVFREE